MSNLYEALDAILIQKIELYAQIIEVMKEEWNSITEYSRERLEKALERKEQMLAEIHGLNHKRETLVGAFAKMLGFPHDTVTLKTIIELKANPLGPKMAERRKLIREQIQTIQELNASNKQLINRSALAMKQSMSWLYEVDTGYTPYFSDGRLSEPSLGSRVVNTDV